MSKLREAQEKFDAKAALAKQVFAEAGEDLDFSQVKCLGEDLDSQAKVERFQKLNQELEDLGMDVRAQEALAKGKRTLDDIDELKRIPVDMPGHPRGSDNARAESKSIGDRFVDSEEYKAFKEDHNRGLAIGFDDVDLKTLFQTSAGWAPESTRTGRVVDAVTRPIQLLDLIPMGQTDQASVVYMEETTRTHSAAETAEATTYPESAFALTERSSQVRKIADSIPVTDEQLEDEAQVRSYLNQRLGFGVRQRLDGQVLNGDGTPPNLEGILNVTGIQTQALGADPRFDAVHKAMTKVRVTGRAMPNAIVLHPNDWEEFRLTRTADGIYILGNPAAAGPMSLFGLPVALGDVIAEGTGLVGDFQNFSQLFERRGLDIQVGFTGTQFVDGQQTLRADIRVAFVVYRPTAFCTVTGI